MVCLNGTFFCFLENEAVKKVNQALKNESRNEYYQALTNPKLGLQKVLDSYAMPLYYEEMKIDREDSMVGFIRHQIFFCKLKI